MRGTAPVAYKQTDPQYKLRLPAELKAAIEASAAENNRTINADIIWHLQFSLGYHALGRGAEEFNLSTGRTVQEFEERLDKIEAQKESLVVKILGEIGEAVEAAVARGVERALDRREDRAQLKRK
jgi:hypothetical protein